MMGQECWYSEWKDAGYFLWSQRIYLVNNISVFNVYKHLGKFYMLFLLSHPHSWSRYLTIRRAGRREGSLFSYVDSWPCVALLTQWFLILPVCILLVLCGVNWLLPWLCLSPSTVPSTFPYQASFPHHLSMSRNFFFLISHWWFLSHSSV